jgi:hypothetical protein
MSRDSPTGTVQHGSPNPTRSHTPATGATASGDVDPQHLRLNADGEQTLPLRKADAYRQVHGALAPVGTSLHQAIPAP